MYFLHVHVFVHFIALSHLIQWTIALWVGATGPSKMTEKAVLYIIPAGPVTECAFVLPSCLDMLTSSHIFRLTHGVYRHVFIDFENVKHF